MENGTDEQKYFILKTFSGTFQFSGLLNVVKGNNYKIYVYYEKFIYKSPYLLYMVRCCI